jgi:RNA polymerase-binding transcription factor DksA
MSKNSIQYSPQKLEKFKIIIENELKMIDKELAKLKDDRQAQKQRLAHTNVDFNQSSKHFQQQSKNKQLISRVQRKSRELQAALKRVEDKTYGVCERTGQLIQEERLAAKPTARFDILKK